MFTCRPGHQSLVIFLQELGSKGREGKGHICWKQICDGINTQEPRQSSRFIKVVFLEELERKGVCYKNYCTGSGNQRIVEYGGFPTSSWTELHLFLEFHECLL